MTSTRRASFRSGPSWIGSGLPGASSSPDEAGRIDKPLFLAEALLVSLSLKRLAVAFLATAVFAAQPLFCLGGESMAEPCHNQVATDQECPGCPVECCELHSQNAIAADDVLPLRDHPGRCDRLFPADDEAPLGVVREIDNPPIQS